MKQELTQDQIAADNMKFRLGGFYSQYKGEKTVGCIYYWLRVYAGVQYAESCCVQSDKRITVSPYSSEKIVNSFEWIEDSPGVFRPRFDFADGFGFAAKEQEIYEKYLLNKQ